MGGLQWEFMCLNVSAGMSFRLGAIGKVQMATLVLDVPGDALF